MDYLAQFKKIMAEQTDIALATCATNSLPNVRIVNFVHAADAAGLLYFASIRDSLKTREIAANPHVALTTIPPSGKTQHVRIQKAIVSKSPHSIFELRQAFVDKISSYDEIITLAGEHLEVYEIRFDNATVTLDFKQMGEVYLSSL